MAELLQEPIPFNSAQDSTSDALAGGAPIAVNVVTDRLGAVRRRPGIQSSERWTTSSISEEIQGIFATSRGQVFGAAGEIPGKLEMYQISETGIGQLPATNGTSVISASRPVFAETEAMVAFTVGGAVYRIQLGNPSYATLSDDAAAGGVPPQASHVVSHSLRILTNDLDQPTKVRYTAPASGPTIGGNAQWNEGLTTALGTSGSITAESRPDPVVAVAENSNEVFVLGTRTFQVFAPDGTLIFAPVSVREHGCASPFAVVSDDQSLAWVDDKRRIIHTDGRTAEVISDPIKSELEGISNEEFRQCWGFRLLRSYVDAMVWVFPNDGRAFAYSKGYGWSIWRGWDSSCETWAPLRITAHTDIDGVNLVATRSESGGVIEAGVAEMEAGVSTDLGAPIRAYVETGFIDRGTQSRKKCHVVRFTLRRGTAAGFDDDPKMMVQWRDREADWSLPLYVSLGKRGERDIVVEKRSLGVYRSRQWRFTFQGAEDFALAKVTEEFEVLSQ